MIFSMEVFLIVALTADGFVGRDEAHSSINWRSKADGQFFIDKTKRAGAVVMGSTTFKTMRRPMPGRKHYVLTSNPHQFAGHDPAVVLPLSGTPQEIIAQAESDGYAQLAICGGSTVYTQFAAANAIDRYFITIEPILFGKGIRLFSQPLEQELQLVQVHQISDQSVVLEYERNNG